MCKTPKKPYGARGFDAQGAVHKKRGYEQAVCTAFRKTVMHRKILHNAQAAVHKILRAKFRREWTFLSLRGGALCADVAISKMKLPT